MKKTLEKIKLILLIISFFFVGMMLDYSISDINAANVSGWVYTANSNAPDSNGDVSILTVNGKTVNSNVPTTVNFSQYNANTSGISAITANLGTYTATTGDVLSDVKFIGSTGAQTTGTMTNNGAVSASVGFGGSYTIPAGYHNGSGTVAGPANGAIKSSLNHIVMSSKCTGVKEHVTVSISVPAGVTRGYLIAHGNKTHSAHTRQAWSVTGGTITSWTDIRNYTSAWNCERVAYVTFNGNAGTISCTYGTSGTDYCEGDRAFIALIY